MENSVSKRTGLVKNRNWRGRLHSGSLILISAAWWFNSATRRLLLLLLRAQFGSD